MVLEDLVVTLTETEEIEKEIETEMIEIGIERPAETTHQGRETEVINQEEIKTKIKIRCGFFLLLILLFLSCLCFISF